MKARLSPIDIDTASYAGYISSINRGLGVMFFEVSIDYNNGLNQESCSFRIQHSCVV
jgi:hypothetical protein